MADMTTRAREVLRELEAELRIKARDYEESAAECNAGSPMQQRYTSWHVREKSRASALSALIAECETAKGGLAEAVKVMEPFAEIALERDSERAAPDMISGPDLAITPTHVRAARVFIARQKEGK